MNYFFFKVNFAKFMIQDIVSCVRYLMHANTSLPSSCCYFVLVDEIILLMHFRIFTLTTLNYLLEMH